MFLAKVVGSLVSTIKHPAYHGRKILLVRPTTPEGKLKKDTYVAVDAIHAGIGDWVLVAGGGGAASDILGLDRRTPMRSVVVGIVDQVDVPGSSRANSSGVRSTET